jgi:hypothetical protein
MGLMVRDEQRNRETEDRKTEKQRNRKPEKLRDLAAGQATPFIRKPKKLRVAGS